MDFLNNAYSQLQAVLKPMSTSSKITTGLLLALVLIGVATLFQYQQLGGDVYLLGGHVFTREEMSAAIAAFADASLNDYHEENFRIRVPRSKRYQYVAAMSQANAMPETASELWGQMFSGSLLESREVKQWRNHYRKKRELERTLAGLSGVKTASVEFDVEKSSTLMGTPKKSALVAVTPSAPRALSASVVQSVRESAAFWLNMDPNEVGVLDMFANRTYRGDSAGSFAGGQDAYSALKAIRESELTKKLYDQLDFIPGAKINVQIELEPEVLHQTTSIKYNDKPTQLQSSTQTEEETVSGGQAGRPGVTTNNDPANSAASVANATTETTRNSTREEQKSIVGQERVMTQKLPYSPKDVTVSIFIPRSHVTKIWRQDNPPAEGEEPTPPNPTQIEAIEKQITQGVEEVVNNLLPRVQAGVDPFPRVVVRFHHDLKPELLEGPSQSALVMDWLQDNLTSIGMGFLGLIGLVFLRGMIKSTGTSSPPGVGDSLGGDGDTGDRGATSAEEAEEESELANSLRERFRGAEGPNLREELADMVREDPDAAATVLSVWIGDSKSDTMMS